MFKQTLTTLGILAVTQIILQPVQASPKIPPTCNAAVQATKTALNRGSVQVTDVSTHQIRGYHNNPAQSPLRLSLTVNTLPKAPKLYQRAAKLLNSCKSIGMVTIGQRKTGVVVNLGKIDGQMKPFRCAEITTPTGTLPWGYELCSW